MLPVTVADLCEDASHVRDAPLTELGKQQSRDLRERFDKHNSISLVLSSPLTRAIQTTVIAFAPAIARPEVEYLLIPKAQEVSAKTCDVGFPSDDLKKRIEKYFEGEDVGSSLAKINYDAVEEGWNSKVGLSGSSHSLRFGLTYARSATGLQTNPPSKFALPI